jgi:glutathione-regulated potassium-efflux system ancillary protein KefG
VSPRVRTEDLVGAAEVAELLGLSHPNSVTLYLRRYEDFPRPVVDLKRSRVRLWLRPQIVAWKAEREQR